MRDAEVVHLLAGWTAVFVGLAAAVLFSALGLAWVGTFWMLLVAAGVLVLGYAFVRFRVPEIKKFIKAREWEVWTRSLVQ